MSLSDTATDWVMDALEANRMMPETSTALEVRAVIQAALDGFVDSLVGPEGT